MNKKGEKMFTPWWFAILAIVGVGIVLGITAFYSSNLDIRSLESSVLLDKISTCVSDEKVLLSLLHDDFDVVDSCSLYKEHFEKGSRYFIKIKLEKIADRYPFLKEHTFGNTALEVNCEAKPDLLKAKSFPECNSEILYLSDEFDKKYKVEIIAASNTFGGGRSDG